MSRPKSLFLLAGSPNRDGDGEDSILKTVLEHTGVEKPSIAYLGSACGDNRRFFGWVRETFTNAGAGAVTLVETVRQFERRSFEKRCEIADAVFISGGDVEAGMNVIGTRRVAPFLGELYCSGKLIFGLSAGSIMLTRSWVRWNKASMPSVFRCLDLAHVFCDVHGESESWEELKALLTLLPDSSVGYGIRAGSALRVDSDGTVAPMRRVDVFIKQDNVVHGAGVLQ